MKWRTASGLSQQEAIARELDLVDCEIISWILDFYPEMHKVKIENKIYFWLRYDYLIQELPILHLTKARAVGLRMKKMQDEGILQMHVRRLGRKKGTFCYFRFNEKALSRLAGQGKIDRMNKRILTLKDKYKQGEYLLQKTSINERILTLKDKCTNTKKIIKDNRLRKDYLRNPSARLCETEGVGLKKEDLKKRKAYRRLAKMLAFVISQVNESKLNLSDGKWFTTIRLIIEKDGFDEKQVATVLAWMVDYYDAKYLRENKGPPNYCLEILAVNSFRRKFPNMKSFVAKKLSVDSDQSNCAADQHKLHVAEPKRERMVMDGGKEKWTKLSAADLKKEREWQEKNHKTGPFPFDNDYPDSKYWTEAKGKRQF